MFLQYKYPGQNFFGDPIYAKPEQPWSYHSLRMLFFCDLSRGFETVETFLPLHLYRRKPKSLNRFDLARAKTTD
jgi:hypothetical protein